MRVLWSVLRNRTQSQTLPAWRWWPEWPRLPGQPLVGTECCPCKTQLTVTTLCECVLCVYLCWGVCVHACCVCTCVVCMGGGSLRARMLEVKRKMFNEVLSCVYAISWVHCALGHVYILLTVLFLDCALQAHVRCKPLIFTILHDKHSLQTCSVMFLALHTLAAFLD